MVDKRLWLFSSLQPIQGNLHMRNGLPPVVLLRVLIQLLGEAEVFQLNLLALEPASYQLSIRVDLLVGLLGL